MEHSLASGVGQFAALLGAALAISIAAERIRIPAAVLLVAAGVFARTLWHVQPPFAFGPTMLFIFLPPLIFEAAWSLDLRQLQANWLRVTILAVPGTIFVACLIGGVLSLSGALPLASALLFGAIVSATDPVAVVAVFRTVAVPTALRTIVEAESISNDGIAVVLYSIAVALATGVSVSWAGASIGGIVAIAGGVAIGAACAVPLWLALWTIDSSEYEVTATLTLAYAAYVIADSLHCSGIFATAAAAISLRALLAQRAHLGYRDQVDGFWNAAAYMANAIVFLATGLLIDPGRVLHEPLLIVVGLAVVLGSRAVLAVLIASSLRDRATVFLAGMRGGLTMALALALPESVRDRAPIIDAVFATVLVTLVAQGVPLRASVERLYGRRAGSGVQPG